MKKSSNYFKWKSFSDKQLKIMTWWVDTSPVKDKNGIIADGAIRSGKTISMGYSFVMWAMTKFDETDFAIAGKTISSLRRNVIKNLLKQLKSLGYTCEYKRTDNLIVVTHNDVTNYFYLFGGKDESSQDLIQGMTLGGILLDEVALMPKSFVEQAMGRCSVEGAKLWFNCNPKGPTHYFKEQYIDKCKELDLLYLHFTMDDNLTLSEKVKERYKKMFSGVFYDRNILGLWVTAAGKIYKSFTDDNIIPISKWYEKEKEGKYTHPFRKNIFTATAGVDFGGNGSATTFNCTVYTTLFQQAIVVKEKRIKEEIDPVQLQNMFIEWAKECLIEYPMLREVYCDSAEQVLIRGLRKAVINNKLPLKIKNARKGEIIDRIRFGLSMFAQYRLFILSDCIETIRAYKDAVWNDKAKDERLDDGTTNVDNLDSTEYSQEPYMKVMIDLTR